MKCQSCDSDFLEGVSFVCPRCNREKVNRCTKCKKTNVKYKCKCGFVGP